MLVRQFLCRRHVDQEYEEQLWASVLFQRLARGFLDRNKALERSTAGALIRLWSREETAKQVLRAARREAVRVREVARRCWNATMMMQEFYRNFKRRKKARAMLRKKKRALKCWEVFVGRLKEKRLIDATVVMAVRCQKLYRIARAERQSLKLEASSVLLQKCWRGVLGRRRAEIVTEARWRLKLVASTFVQRNWRRKVFWRDMKARAIVTQERKALVDASRSLLQRWFRHELVRMRFLVAFAEMREEKQAAIKIQALFRGHSLRYKQACSHALNTAHWGFFYCFVYRVSFKNAMAKLVQTRFRAYIRQRVEERAAVNIQRLWRGHAARVLKALLLYRRFEAASKAVQRIVRVHLQRKQRKLLIQERELASHQIQRCFRAWRLRKYLRDMRTRTIQTRAAAVSASKEQLLVERHRQLIEGMLNRGKEIAATKIQRQFRAHRARKQRAASARMKAEAAMRAEMQRQERLERMQDRKAKAKTLEGRTKKLVKGFGEGLTTVKADKVDVKKKVAEAKAKAGDFASTLTSKAPWTGRKHPKEQEERNQMLDGAVLNHHTRTSVVTGVVDLKVTVGSLDAANFQEANDQRQLAKQPTWTLLKKDLSGSSPLTHGYFYNCVER
jgi:hypothetical protein